MASIRQIPSPHPLPDWRNFGVVLRILLGINVLALAAALLQAGGLAAWLVRYVELAAWVEPLLLVVLGLLAGLRDLLWRLPARPGQGGVMALAAVLAGLQYDFWAWLGLADRLPFGALRAALLAAAAAGLLLAYFELRSRAFSPVEAEARLAALNARIRPHFLFNSLNTVLSLIRAEPKRAEAALESLADLFRAALKDQRELVPLSDEIALGRQYLELEKLRLGERLRLGWEVADVPLDTLIPPLMLQPLLENAVYHGIEPAPEGGEVHIGFARRGEELAIEIANPMPAAGQHAAGHQMAVANIRERLALYYDLEARLEVRQEAGSYSVRITLPCRTRNHPSPS
ncbi:MAG: Histidine kinase internal region [Rhodocyclaceae bacterium]|nr:Histidine kinase internal region [Rhodocyclaceae bacterium]